MTTPNDIASADDRSPRLLRLLAVIVVRPSFERCCRHGDEFFDTFYATLAIALPPVTELFHGVDMHQQNALIRDGITRLLDYAEGIPGAETELERIHRSHGPEGLDIDPAWYATWMDTLLATVAEFDDQHTPDLIAAWREVVRPGLRL